MCYVNAVIPVNAEPGKKKLVERKEEVREEKSEIRSPTSEINPKPEIVNPKPAILDVVEEPKVEVNPKSEFRTRQTTQPVKLGKKNKVLTVDSMQDLHEQSDKNVVEQKQEEKFEGEILLLSQVNIEKLWDEYAARIPDEKKGLKISFATYRPVLDETVLNKITLKVQSDIQKSQFENVRLGVQNFISARVGAAIELEIIADKKIDNATKPYTPKEKLERLIEKNPAIKKMQQQLGLELDYD
jgi:hypothetical protein